MAKNDDVKLGKIDINTLRKDLETEKVFKDYKQPYFEGLEVQKFLISKLDENTNLLQRLQAEFENFKKRTDKEKSDFVKFSTCNIITKLLPILDNFELAIKNKENKDEFIAGVEMIYEQFLQTLQDAGLEKIRAEGCEFDPYKHEALLQEESENDNIVLQELQTGYVLGDKVLRHTKVKIGKSNNKKGESNE